MSASTNREKKQPSIGLWNGSNIDYVSNMEVEKLIFNPLNPRMVEDIPAEELKLDELCSSIMRVGILVPLVVFERNGKYIVLDGERRLRAALRLHMRTVPVNILPKEMTDAENLATMFSIHMQRERWNTAARAVSLSRLEKFLPGKTPEEIRKISGMRDAEYRNAQRILRFPKDLQMKAVREEWNPNYLIEMDKAIKSIERHLPDLLQKHTRDSIVTAWADKIESNTVQNNTDFRAVSRICRELSEERAEYFVNRLIEDTKYGFVAAWEEAAEEAVERIANVVKSRGDKLISIIRKIRAKELELKHREEITKILQDVKASIDTKLSELK